MCMQLSTFQQRHQINCSRKAHLKTLNRTNVPTARRLITLVARGSTSVCSTRGCLPVHPVFINRSFVNTWMKQTVLDHSRQSCTLTL